jgi:hypothetical protein
MSIRHSPHRPSFGGGEKRAEHILAVARNILPSRLDSQRAASRLITTVVDCWQFHHESSSTAMGVGFWLTGNRSVFEGYPGDRDFRSKVEEWLHTNAGEQLENLRKGADHKGRPGVFAQLHPAAEELEVLVPDAARVIVTAKTSTVGPGYHPFVCDVVKHLGGDLGISWDPPDDDGGTGDETGFFHTGDYLAVENEMLRWLRSVMKVEAEVDRRARPMEELPLIGYRREAVRAYLSGGWSIEIPGAMAEEWDTEGTWSAWDGERTVWFTAFTRKNDDGSDMSAQDILAAASDIGRETIKFQAERVIGRAALLPYDENGEQLWNLKAQVAAAGAFAVCNIYFHEMCDREWAISTWKSLKHT